MPFRRIRVFATDRPNPPKEWLVAAEAVDRLLGENGLILVPPAGADAADGLLALPGGVDSLKDLFDLWMPGSESRPQAPCGLLNLDNYYSALLRAADDTTVERFVQETQRGALIVDREPATLLRAMADFQPPETRRQPARDDL